MGIPFDGHITIELDIGDKALELCVSLACELHPGSPCTHDDPGSDPEVEIVSVGDVWEEFWKPDEAAPGGKRKVKTVYGPPALWMQDLIMKHAVRDDLMEQAPDPAEPDDI